jgi:hypothetical protein
VLPLAAAAALLLAGCNGGTVDRHALTNDAATIGSINCEAWLLGRATARGRTTTEYTGEQAEELGIQAANFADALARRPTSPGLEKRVRKKAGDAAVLARRLRRLQQHPGDRSLAGDLAARFQQAGGCQ